MNKYYLLVIMALVSCSKRDDMPEVIDEGKSAEQLERNKEGASTISNITQGLAVEIYRNGSKIIGSIIIYSGHDDASEVDFTVERQVQSLIRSATHRITKEKYREYGFALDPGKYLVAISTRWPQTPCPTGALCIPPTYYSVKEFEVLNGAKTGVKIDFRGIDGMDDPNGANYVVWEGYD